MLSACQGVKACRSVHHAKHTGRVVGYSEVGQKTGLWEMKKCAGHSDV